MFRLKQDHMEISCVLLSDPGRSNKKNYQGSLYQRLLFSNEALTSLDFVSFLIFGAESFPDFFFIFQGFVSCFNDVFILRRDL